MQLEEFFDYKNQLMDDLLTSEKIVKLLKGDATLEDAGDLMYEQVFPFEYIPETVQDARTFICCEVDIQRVYNKTFLSPTLFIWVFTHKSLMRLPEGGVRVDKLCSEICKEINGSRNYGLGELELATCKRFAPITDFQGKVMMFEAKDFNRTHDLAKPAPANRKRG